MGKVQEYYVTFIKTHLKPDMRRIDESDIDFYLDAAVAEYSRDHPYLKVSDIASTDWDTSNYILPVPSDWDVDFSYIEAIEFPSGSQQPTYLDNNDYTLYRFGTDNAATSWGIRYISFTPSTADTSETSRITYAVPHTVDETAGTIPANHEEAVGYLAAAKAAKALAASYNSLSHTAEGLEFTDFSGRASQFLEMATSFEMKYRDLSGLQNIEGPIAGMAFKDVDSRPSWNLDFYAHPKETN